MATVDLVASAILMVVVVWAAIMVLAQLRDNRRLWQDLGLKPRDVFRVMAIFPTYPARALDVLLPVVAFAVTAPAHPGRLKILFVSCFVGVGFLLALAEDFLSRSRRSRPGWLPLSRGTLAKGVVALASRARAPKVSVTVLPDDSRMPEVDGRAWQVFIRLRCLNCLSRGEIDALAARQLTRQQHAYRLPVAIAALCWGLAAAGICELANIGFAGRWLVFLAAVVAGIAGLVPYFLSAERKADIRAIGITGNADAYFSATGESARLNGTPLDAAALERVARGVGMPLDRMRELRQPRPRPAEDRYPTSGDYVNVGF